MSAPVPSCTNCGTNLSMDDLRGDNCRYCGTALPHRARAAEQVAVVQQMLGPLAPNAMMYGQQPPPAGGFGAPYNPYNNAYNPYAQAQQQMQQGAQAAAAGASIMIFVVIAVVALVLVVAGLAFALVLVRAG